MNPDPGGTKTYGSGSAAQVTHLNYPTHRFEKIPILSRETAALKQQQVLLQIVPEVERQPHIFGPILSSDTPVSIGQEDLKQQNS